MQTAQAQAGLNQSTATTQQLLNMTDQVNPWGSVKYDQTGNTGFVDSNGKWVSVPKFTQTTTYSPEQQSIFDKSTQAQTNLADIASEQSARLGQYLNDPFSFNQGQVQSPTIGGPQGEFNPSDFSFGQPAFDFNNNDASNWAYDLASQRILPQQQQDTKQLESQLINRGLRPGTAAWDSELKRLGQTQSDQLNQLALTGRQQAYQEALTGRQQNYNEALSGQQQNFNQDLSARGLNFDEALQRAQAQFGQDLSARQQNFSEAVTQRNQPLNELTALMSGSQIANPGQASGPTPQTGVGGVDYSGLVQDNYKAQLANSGGFLGGLFGLAGTLGGAALGNPGIFK